MRIMVVNPGSSSVKLSVVTSDRMTALGRELIGDDGASPDALGAFLDDAGDVDGLGVRFVHGGPTLTQSVVVDASVEERIEAVVDLAPLHNPPALATLKMLRQLRPGVPVIACFDTAFHRTMPPAAATYALPEDWRRMGGFHRYGFHGLSHAWATRRLREILGSGTGSRRLVTCHLGAGASLAAVLGGRSVDTTMGFTPMDGLVMATRSGSIDPGIVLWLLRHAGLGADELEQGLDRRSGLAGLSGIAGGDMRAVLQAASEADGRAILAVDCYVHRLSGAIAQMSASLGGLDAVAFTGGVGEGSAVIRERVGEPLGFLGIAIDPPSNEMVAEGDREITGTGARVRTFVVRAREDLEIAGEVVRLLR
ncbi:MAG: acetate/propionate family kinase [Acidimicrobiales bacterium]